MKQFVRNLTFILTVLIHFLKQTDLFQIKIPLFWESLKTPVTNEEAHVKHIIKLRDISKQFQFNETIKEGLVQDEEFNSANFLNDTLHDQRVYKIYKGIIEPFKE